MTENKDVLSLEKENEELKEEYIKLAKKYEKLHDKLYAKDFFEVEPAGKYTEDSRKFQNGLCVFNNRLGMAYSVTEIVEVLNSLVKNQDLIIRLFDDKIEYLKDDVEIAIKAGISPSKIYNEINRLEELKEKIINVMYND